MRQCAECGAVYGDDVLFCTIDESPTTILVSASTPAKSPQPGSVIGNYTLKSLLGVGGMGLVYLAEHTRLKRKVALKLLRPEFAHDAVAIRRFFAEARAVNEIAHENIVEVTDFVDEGDHRYFVMELLQGHALNDVLQRSRLTLARAVHIGRQVANALTAAHEAGVVHRDLKPQNIFLIRRAGTDDFVKVLDFGIAKVRGLEPGDTEKTQAGTFVGTPAYMAPEQLSQKTIDHRVDVYAFGVVLFELVVGQRPFRGGSVGELIVQQLTVQPQKPSDVMKQNGEGFAMPEQLEKLILDCLSKDPTKRPATMREISATLASVWEMIEPLRQPPKSNSGNSGANAHFGDDSSGTGDYALPSSGGWIVVPAQKQLPSAAPSPGPAKSAAKSAAPAPIALPEPVEPEMEFVDEIESLDDPSRTNHRPPEAAAAKPSAPAAVSAKASAASASTASAPKAASTAGAAVNPFAMSAKPAAPASSPSMAAPVASTPTTPAKAPVNRALFEATLENTADSSKPEHDFFGGEAANDSTSPTVEKSFVAGAEPEVRYPIAMPSSSEPQPKSSRRTAIAAGVAAAVVLGIVGVVAVTMSGEKEANKVAVDDSATKPGDAKPGDAKPGDAKPGDAKPGDAKVDDSAKPADGAKVDDAKPSDGAAKNVEVSFDSKPAGATVVVDGNEIGAAPIKAKVAAGSASVVFKLDGYASKTVSAKLVEGGTVTATLVALAKPAATKPAVTKPATTTTPATSKPATTTKPAETPDIKDGALINPFAKKKPK